MFIYMINPKTTTHLYIERAIMSVNAKMNPILFGCYQRF